MSHDITQKYLALKKSNIRHPILPAMAERFSPRWYSSDPIPEQDLDRMLEAARWAPSGRNLQPWYFYVATKGRSSYVKVLSTVSEHNQWSKTAPVLIVACFIESDAYGKNPFANYDLGAAVFSLILEAQSLGYYARQMGMFDKEKLRKVVSIDSTHTPFVIIALGKLGDYTKIDDELLKRELTPRERKTDVAKKI